jgi:lambda family phage portal protein
MMNLIDRTLLAVAPARALARAKDRLQAQTLMDLSDAGNGVQASARADGEDQSGSSGVGRRWWSPRARDARADTIRQLPTQRGQSRDLARTSPIAVGAINTNVDRVVGTGLALSAQPNLFVLGWTSEQATQWKRHVQAEFSLWSDSAESDICNTLDFYEQQALILRSALESGDCFTVLPDGQPTRNNPYRLRIQALEADRIGNPGNKMDEPLVSGGVRFDEAGAPKAYHVYDQHPGASILSAGGALFAGNWVDAVGATGRRRMLHHFRKLRPGQPRGVPYLAPIVDIIKQLSRYTNAEINAAVISSYFTAFIETSDGNAAPVFQGAKGAETPSDPIEMGSGAVVGLATGEKVTFADPTRPNPNFDGFTIAMLRQVGMALSIPHELLMKQFNSSYSASKAALLDAGIYFRTVRTWLARSFCQPVYETWLAEAVATGRISAPGFFADPLLRWAYTRAAWNGDSMGSINPKDEVAAYTAAVDARLMTRERAEWELFGTDFNETFDAKKAEQDKLRVANMLPVPKAGAAAPSQDAANPDTPPA